jgi:hypothetical protein
MVCLLAAVAVVFALICGTAEARSSSGARRAAHWLISKEPKTCAKVRYGVGSLGLTADRSAFEYEAAQIGWKQPFADEVFAVLLGHCGAT